VTNVSRVVFVCEHGAAKSVLAASYFNHLAVQRGLPLRALARGTAPDAEIPRGVLEGLAREGLAPCTSNPQALGPADLVGALKVVSFDQPQVAALVREPDSAISWDQLPPVSDDFNLARAAIFERVERLLSDLEAHP